MTLNVMLNVTQRLALVNDIFNESLTYNGSYSLTSIQMVINPASGILSMKTIKRHSFYSFFFF
jgi:hypothetical protein